MKPINSDTPWATLNIMNRPDGCLILAEYLAAALIKATNTNTITINLSDYENDVVEFRKDQHNDTVMLRLKP